MIITKETQLNQSLKESGAAGLYLLWGEDDYLISRWRDKILAPFDREGGFNLQKLDGQNLDLNEVYDATQQLPLLASQKAVLVDDIDPKALNAEELRKLDEVLSQLPKETVLVLTFRANEVDGRSAFGKKLVALGDKYGTVVELTTRMERDLVRFLQSQAADWGCKLSAPLGKEILRLVGRDMLTLTQEIKKVSAYAQGQEITQAHIDAVVTPTTQERVFDLGKAILAGNGQRAMTILSNLYYLRESPIAIVATLIMTYIDLYRVRIGRDQGASLPEITALFPYKGREFRLRNAYNTAISAKGARRALEILYRCDKGMKSLPQDPEEQLERAVLELLALGGL